MYACMFVYFHVYFIFFTLCCFGVINDIYRGQGHIVVAPAQPVVDVPSLYMTETDNLISK